MKNCITSASTGTNSVTLKMEAVRTFKVLEHLITTQCRNPTYDHHVNNNHCENLKTYFMKKLLNMFQEASTTD